MLSSRPALERDAHGDPYRTIVAQRRIWLMAADGLGKRALTGDADYRDERPEWSSDGRLILFARLHSEQAQLWAMRPDGSGPEQVVEELTPSPGTWATMA